MGLLERVAEFRERQILGHARPHLDDGEQVEMWGRIRQPAGKRVGFIYVTDRRVVVYWTTGRDVGTAFRFDVIEAWGLKRSPGAGPILVIEGDSHAETMQLSVPTPAAALNAMALVERFTRLAPRPRRALDGGDDHFTTDPIEVAKESRSVAGHTRRVVVTAVGVVLLSGGVVLSLPLVPGPGFIVIIAGFAVLASEYDWAQDLLTWAKGRYRRAKSAASRRRAGSK